MDKFTTSVAPAAMVGQRVGQVGEQLNNMDANIKELQHGISAFITCLVPVLAKQPEEEEKNKIQAVELEPYAPIAQTLFRQNCAIQDSIKKLRETINRLEV